MRVRGLANLFVDGEKSGLFVGHIEAVVTGALAGCNSVRYGIGMPLLMKSYMLKNKKHCFLFKLMNR